MKTSLNNLIFEYQLEINYNTEENQKLYTGLSKLDFATNGFSRGSLNMIAARQGNGITSFKNTLLNELKLKTTIISKSNANKFLHSLLSYKSGVSKAKISHKVFSNNDFIYVNNSFKEVQNLPIFIKKKKKLTLGFLDSYLKKNEEIDCLLIENLDSFLEKEKILFKGLKELAKKKNVVLICFYELEEVASCNPYLEIKPSISDFKNSFSLKKTLNNIDNLIFIFRPEFYNIPNFYKTKEATEGKAVISIYRKEEELKEIIVGFSGGKNIFSDLKNYKHLNWVEKLKVLNS